jgi:hypothetical protein
LFNPRDPASFLARPFPRWRKIILQIVVTTIIGFLVAFIVVLYRGVD